MELPAGESGPFLAHFLRKIVSGSRSPRMPISKIVLKLRESAQDEAVKHFHLAQEEELEEEEGHDKHGQPRQRASMVQGTLLHNRSETHTLKELSLVRLCSPDHVARSI